MSEGRLQEVKSIQALVSVSMITVSYRDDEQVDAFLAHLAPLCTGSVQVIIVRNACPATAPPLRKHGLTSLLELRNADNRGFAAAFNQGLRAADGDVVMSLNSDVILTREVLTALTTAALTSPQQPIVVAPLLTNENGPVFGRKFYSPVSLVLARTRARVKLVLAPDAAGVEWVLGACFTMRRQALLTLGGLDERFFLYFEDVDLCWRVWDHGGAVRVLPESRVHHTHHRTSRRVSRVLLWHVRSAIRFFILHPEAIVGRGPRLRRH